VIEQKILYYDYYLAPQLRTHSVAQTPMVWLKLRLPMVFKFAPPHPALIALLPLSVLALTEVRRRAIWASLPTFLIAYAMNPVMLVNYAVAWLPLTALAVVLGKDAIERLWPAQRETIAAALWLVIAAACVMEIPPFVSDSPDRWNAPLLTDVRQKLAHLPHTPAVVLFRYQQPSNPHEEPVYNFDVAWPDDAPIIKAHDLGPARDAEIVSYYAQRQPNRYFYLYDRGDMRMYELGRADELERTLPAPTTR
jgi:hypothetical protein